MNKITSSLLSFLGGATLGAAVGVGIYLVATSDHDEGILQGVKSTIQNAIEEGRRAAEERRRELERELGFPIDQEPELRPLPFSLNVDVDIERREQSDSPTSTPPTSTTPDATS